MHAARIETLVPALGAIADYVTARAVAPLPDLCEMIAPFLKKGAKAFLLKGQDLDIELTRATKHWNIEAETVARLDRFVALLLTWQGRINLISPSTICRLPGPATPPV